jgi:hypothetical protein
MQNRRQHGIVTACDVTRTEEDENVDSDGRTDRQYYSHHCEDNQGYEGIPQDHEQDFIRVSNVGIYCGDGQYALPDSMLFSNVEF